MTARPPQTAGVAVGDVERSDGAYWIWTGDRWIPAAGVLTRKMGSAETGGTANGGVSAGEGQEQ